MDIREAVEKSITMEFMSMIVYQDLSNRLADKGAVETVTYLSKQEERHLAHLIGIFSSLGDESAAAVEKVDVVRGHRGKAMEELEKALEDRGINRESPVEEILDFAIDAERHAFSRYINLSQKCGDEKLEEIFRTIAMEEKSHEENILRLMKELKG